MYFTFFGKDIMKTKLSKIILLVPVLVTVLYYLFGHIQYFVVDDQLMNYIVDGVYGTKENQWMILPYMSVIISYFMYVLKNIFENVNIYLMTMLMLYTIAFIVIEYILYNKYHSLWLALIIAIVQIILFQCFTYTMIAYITCFTGLLLLWVSERKGKFLAVILLIIGISIRKDVFLSLLVMFIPYIVYMFIKNDKRKGLINIVISLLCFISIGVVNNIVIRDNDAVKNYLEWNEKSTLIRDYPKVDYAKVSSQLTDLGVTRNDIRCLSNWIFVEKDTLGNKQLDAIDQQRPIYEKYQLHPIELMKSFLQEPYFVIYTLIGLFVLIIIKWKNALSASLILSTLACFGALLVRQRVVSRVYIPIIFISILMLIFTFMDSYKELRLKKNWQLVLMSTFMIFVIGVYGKEVDFHRVQKTIYNQETYDYINKNSDNLFVFESFKGMVESQHPIEKLKFDKNLYHDNMMTLGNWDTFSVRYYNQMNKYHIDDPDHFIANMLEYDHVRFIFNKDSLKKKTLIRWFEEHQNKKVDFKEVDRVSKYIVYEIKEV